MRACACACVCVRAQENSTSPVVSVGQKMAGYILSYLSQCLSNPDISSVREWPVKERDIYYHCCPNTSERKMGDDITMPIFKRGDYCLKFFCPDISSESKMGREMLRPIFKLSNYCFCCPDKLFHRRENGHEIPWPIIQT